jgi:aryl-alcohol dehydrogenase-like predicted oxidoreductase
MVDSRDRFEDGEPNTRLTRRSLLTSGSAAGIAAALVPEFAGAGEPAKAVPKVRFGNTGMMVSRLALGGSWDIDQEVLSVAFSQGINYIDTAESYRGGQSERLIGQFLQSVGATGHTAARKKIWLVSKTHDHRTFENHLPGSLERLQQDYVDCYYMHQIRDPKLTQSAEVKAQADRLKKAGKTRFFGFSVHDEPVVECLNAAAESDYIDAIMFRYDCHYYPREALLKAIEKCHAKGIGLVAMKTQVGGMTLPDKFNPFKQRGLNQHQAAIKAVAADPHIHAVCSEMTTTEMVTQNSSAMASPISLAELDAIKEHARLVSHLWCRGCDHICKSKAGAGGGIAVADALRFLMYHDHYGKRDHARDLFAGLSEDQRSISAIEAGDWAAAQQACPFQVPLTTLMARVRRIQDARSHGRALFSERRPFRPSANWLRACRGDVPVQHHC